MVLLSLLFFALLLTIAIKGFKKRSILSFSILFYLSTFAIFANLFSSTTIGSTIGERFMFIPSLGFSIFIVYGLYTLISKLKIKSWQYALLLPILVIATVFSLKSYARIPVWKDNFTLSASGISSAPKSWRTQVLYADNLRMQAVKLTKDTTGMLPSKIDSSKALFKKAISHYNEGFSILGNRRASKLVYLNGLGECYLHLSDTAKAEATFIKAIKNPNPSYGLFKLGIIAYNNKNYEAAIDYYKRSLIDNSSRLFVTHKNLGTAYLLNKDYKNAIFNYEKALEYGSSEKISSNLSILYSKVGNIKKSNELLLEDTSISAEERTFINDITAAFTNYDTKKYNEAINLFKKCNPNYQKYGGYKKYPKFLNAWARSYLNLNEINTAKSVFNKVLNENPQDNFALQNLGFIAFQHDKQYAQAINYFERGLLGNSPDFFSLYSNLGSLYLLQNKTDKAIENFENSLKYGSNKSIIGNLYLLWKTKGNTQKIAFYQNLLDKSTNN